MELLFNVASSQITNSRSGASGARLGVLFKRKLNIKTKENSIKFKIFNIKTKEKGDQNQDPMELEIIDFYVFSSQIPNPRSGASGAGPGVLFIDAGLTSKRKKKEIKFRILRSLTLLVFT